MSDLGPVQDHRDAINQRLTVPMRTDEVIRRAKRSNGAFLWVVTVAVISGVGASALLVNQTKSVSDQQMAAAEDRGRAEAMGDQALFAQHSAQAAPQAATLMSLQAQQSPAARAARAAEDRTVAEALSE